MKSGDELRLSQNSLDTLIKKVDLVENGKVVPACVQIYENWFTKYSTDDKMTKEHCACFLRDVTGIREAPPISDSRITGLFESFDKENKGYLERKDFVGFYVDCTLKEERKRTVWENLKAMNVRNDLKMVLKT